MNDNLLDFVDRLLVPKLLSKFSIEIVHGTHIRVCPKQYVNLTSALLL